MAIYNIMQFVRCDIVTSGIDQGIRIGTILWVLGTKGKGFAFPNSRILIHHPMSRANGKISDISLATKDILKWRKVIKEILAQYSSRSREQIEKDCLSRSHPGQPHNAKKS
jgi:ATP-dependent Clp protease protease subunit